jgi:hypothetical protein
MVAIPSGYAVALVVNGLGMYPSAKEHVCKRIPLKGTSGPLSINRYGTVGWLGDLTGSGGGWRVLGWGAWTGCQRSSEGG